MAWWWPSPVAGTAAGGWGIQPGRQRAGGGVGPARKRRKTPTRRPGPFLPVTDLPGVWAGQRYPSPGGADLDGQHLGGRSDLRQNGNRRLVDHARLHSGEHFQNLASRDEGQRRQPQRQASGLPVHGGEGLDSGSVGAGLGQERHGPLFTLGGDAPETHGLGQREHVYPILSGERLGLATGVDRDPDQQATGQLVNPTDATDPGDLRRAVVPVRQGNGGADPHACEDGQPDGPVRLVPLAGTVGAVGLGVSPRSLGDVGRNRIVRSRTVDGAGLDEPDDLTLNDGHRVGGQAWSLLTFHDGGRRGGRLLGLGLLGLRHCWFSLSVGRARSDSLPETVLQIRPANEPGEEKI